MTTLDAKSLQESGRQLRKAHEGGDPPSTLLNLLAPLEKWQPTEDLLRQSKIGVVVAGLRANKDTKVASKASQLVNKWKAAVKKKGAGSTGSPAPAGGAVNGASGTGSPVPVKKETVIAPKKYSVAPEKRNSKEDGVDTAVTGNTTRDGCVTLIYNGLAFMSTESPDDILAVSRQVEMAAYESLYPADPTSPAGQAAVKAYTAKMRSLGLNLKMKQSVALRRDVYSGEIEPKRFVNMTSEELKSEERRKEDKALNKENMNKSMTPQEQKAFSTTMQCGKCKAYKVSYTQAQTRSADEPLTTFCECGNCGHKWKFS